MIQKRIQDGTYKPGDRIVETRLCKELAVSQAPVREAMLEGRDLRADPALAAHADWAEDILRRREFTAENAEAVLCEEVGHVFMLLLEHAGVYKRTPEGRAAFLRFIDSVHSK